MEDKEQQCFRFCLVQTIRYTAKHLISIISIFFTCQSLSGPNTSISIALAACKKSRVMDQEEWDLGLDCSLRQ